MVSGEQESFTMAQPPHPAPKPAPKPEPKPEPPKPAAHEAKGKEPAIVGRDMAAREGEERGYPPTIGVKGAPIEDGERDPDTVAEEQRARSAEIEAMGSEAWKAAHDERGPGDRLDNALPPPGARKLEHDTREPIARRP
jgi:hypothetical protein